MRPSPLRLFGREHDGEQLEWSWVDQQLTDAGTYWVVAGGTARPVWGVWADDAVHLSIGSPTIRQRIGPDAFVHLDSGTDVVLVEGRVEGETADESLIAAYDAKYDWTYTVEEYGPLTTVRATVVKAWRSGGWAGRDGFQATGRFASDA